MKKVLYKIGLGMFAVMGLTSFNPLTEKIHLARIEGSTSFAQTSAPAKKPAAAPAKKPAAPKATKAPEAPPPPPVTAAPGLFERAYEKRTNGWAGKPGLNFNTQDDKHKFRISSITFSDSTTGSAPDEFDLDNTATGIKTTRTVQICVDQVSATEATVCLEEGGICAPIRTACGPININLQDLEKSDKAALDSLKLQAKNLLVDEGKRVGKELLAKREQELSCDFKNKKGEKDHDKILDCARDNYGDHYDNKKLRNKYARMLKSSVMALAHDENTDPEKIHELLEELDISSGEPELYKSVMAAYKLSKFMQPVPGLFAYDPKEKDFRAVNIPDYYELELQNLVYASNEREGYGIRQDPQIMADQIKSLSDNYASRLTMNLGQPSVDGWGIDSTDYRSLVSGYTNSIPLGLSADSLSTSNMFAKSYGDLHKLIYPEAFAKRYLRDGMTESERLQLNLRATNNPIWNKAECYDSILPTTTNRCGNPRVLDELGNGSRGRSSLSNYPVWLDAARKAATTSSVDSDWSSFLN